MYHGFLTFHLDQNTLTSNYMWYILCSTFLSNIKWLPNGSLTKFGMCSGLLGLHRKQGFLYFRQKLAKLPQKIVVFSSWHYLRGFVISWSAESGMQPLHTPARPRLWLRLINVKKQIIFIRMSSHLQHPSLGAPPFEDVGAKLQPWCRFIGWVINLPTGALRTLWIV
jgi:hypothetical protein